MSIMSIVVNVKIRHGHRDLDYANLPDNPCTNFVILVRRKHAKTQNLNDLILMGAEIIKGL